LDTLRDSLNKNISNDIRLEIQEIKKPDLVASLVAENVALQLERRISFRRAMKKAVQSAMRLGVKGVTLCLSGE
jgi:small subunit ribosomal protein S3